MGLQPNYGEAIKYFKPISTKGMLFKKQMSYICISDYKSSMKGHKNLPNEITK
jgi:hypothetical protein